MSNQQAFDAGNPAMMLGVLGGGAWGTALAAHLCTLSKNVRLWVYEPKLAESINRDHENAVYLPDVKLPQELIATSDMAAFAKGLSLLLIVTPSHVTRQVVTELRPFLPLGIPIICASKGIENSSLLTMNGVLEEVLGIEARDRLAYLSGPSFALDVALGKATAVSLACTNQRLGGELQRFISNDRFRAYTTRDVIGVELGGSLKNVIAIAAGAAEGMDLGRNATAALVTRGLAEMTRLCVRLGGEALTLSGMSGLGDLVLTCYGELSRNRSLGIQLGQGQSLDDILNSRQSVAEGVKTAKSAYELAQKYDVDMPITQRVFEGLYEGKAPAIVLYELMDRTLKHELEFSGLTPSN